MPELQPNEPASAQQLPPIEAADSCDYAFGCECADPSLQIERWGCEVVEPPATH
jgi:hypothetical protein